MNEHLKVTCHECYVGPATEVSPFTDAFWEGLDGVCNALDNMEARFYVDRTCVMFEKSLLESGTMGTSGNVRSRRFEVLRRLHAIDATRVHLTMPGVVSFLLKRPFGPRRDTAT